MHTWIQTYTGKHFDVFNPKIEDICIEDIAHGLALKCRFNGQCNTFYSVAEHCVRMATWELSGDPKARLFHDAAEAYIPDLQSPIKQVMPKFQEIENKILKIIYEKFNIPYYNIEEDVKEADLIMLSTEARDLMNDPAWEPLPLPYYEKIEPWSWQLAEQAFLTMEKLLKIV